MEEEIIASLRHIDYRKSVSTLSEEMAQLSATQHYQVFPELRRERKQPIINNALRCLKHTHYS